MYFINEITALELEEKFDCVTPDMPGALEDWDENVNYIELLRRNNADDGPSLWLESTFRICRVAITFVVWFYLMRTFMSP